MSEVKTEFDFELLVALTKDLTALINQEAECLRVMKISGITELQKEKNEVAAQLEKQQYALKENPENRARLTDEQKSTLKAAAVEFDTAIQFYQSELFKAKKVNQMIIAKMMEIVNDHVMKNRAYGANGAKNMSGTELAKNTPALKYNAQA